MRALRDAIMTYGKGLGADIVKVDMFLNHRIDTTLLFQMGEEFANRFRQDQPNLVLTVEASGIAIAVATARALGDLPVVFAKKSATVVQSPDVAQAKVYSFTHKRENVIRVDKQYLPAGSRVLIIDDFLADGQACQGMMALCAQTDCPVVGIGIVYILFRSLGKICGAHWSSCLAKSPAMVRKYLGITLLPQAGVALGMCATAYRVLGGPEGTLIRSIVLFSVLIYELLGPSLTKMALTKAGDIQAIPQEVTSRRKKRLQEITKPVPPAFDK